MEQEYHPVQFGKLNYSPPLYICPDEYGNEGTSFKEQMVSDGYVLAGLLTFSALTVILWFGFVISIALK
jgi:hypothetical protein